MILHATEQGAGPPVALLHGLFGRSQNFATLARRLAGRFRVMSLDLRNHGASPHADGMAYETLAADVAETLAAHGTGPVRVLGHSMGGKVAMALALTNPAAVCRLIVADIAPVPYAHHTGDVARALLGLSLVPGLTRASAMQTLAEAVPDEAIRAFLLQNLAFAPTPAWRMGLAEIAAGMADIEGWPALRHATRFEGPTLFLAGARSDYLLPAHYAAIHGLFPNAMIETLEDAGHWLHADQPEAFAIAVETFLDEFSTSARAKLR